MVTPKDDWAGWLAAHGPGLLLLARQYVPCHADAEDVVHEAFLAYWSVRNRVTDRTAYLYSSVRNAALNWVRSHKRRAIRECSSARSESQSWFIGEPSELQQQLAELPADQREVLVMKIWGRLTFEQIATALQISPNTAASRYRYALEKLRAHLAMETSHE